MEAMNEYKRLTNRLFPTWSEVLEVVRSLGYKKPARSGRERGDQLATQANDRPVDSPLRKA